MDSVIDLLNERATELLEGARALDTDLSDSDSEPSIEVAAEQLRRLCETLTFIVSQLEQRDSPLHQLVRTIDGVKLSHSVEKLSKYLADHRATLIRLQVPEHLVSGTIDALSFEASNGENALDQPQSLGTDDALEPLRQLRNLVCEIANSAEVATIVADHRILKQVAAGCIGAATVILDITAAITAAPSDPSAWVLFKAVKSIWGGGNSIYKAVRELRGMLTTILQHSRTESNQEKLRRIRPKRLKKG